MNYVKNVAVTFYLADIQIRPNFFDIYLNMFSTVNSRYFPDFPDISMAC